MTKETPLQQMLIKLKSTFPEAVTETEKTDTNGKPYTVYALKNEFVQQLKDVDLDITNNQNRYELQFPGKQMAKTQVLVPCYKTLVADLKQSKNFDNTGNLFIEGDNLDALKMLQNSYRGRIKMIYIDPPYNTGGDDFIYNDNFSVTQKKYLQKMGYLDENGERQISEIQNGLKGRFHAGWLAFMYPRLKLARELLSDDGVIFISIDDNEQANLRLVCDEIFGEENFVNNFVWINNLKGRQISNSGASKTHEHILAYSRDAELLGTFNIEISSANSMMPNAYKMGNYDTYEDNEGTYVIKNELHNTNRSVNEETRPNLVYNIHYNEDSQQVKFSSIEDEIDYPGYVKITPKTNNDGTHKYHAWRWEKQKVSNELHNLHFYNMNGSYKIYTKIRDYTNTRLKDILTDINSDKALAGLSLNHFSNPKPVLLIKILVNSSIDSTDAIILDFFAGSATTAHAVMQLNAEDGGQRKFIMVQLPEKIDPKKSKEAYQFCTEELNRPTTIAEIAKERIRRAGKQIVRKQKVAHDIDIGFRAFTIKDSLLTTNEEKPLAEITQQALQHYMVELKPENFKPLLYETLLKTGTKLNLPIAVEKMGDYPFAICDRSCYCVTEALTQEIVQKIAEKYNDQFDILYYLSDALDAKISFTEIEAVIHQAPGNKQIQGLSFY